MPNFYVPPLGGPLYWGNEQSGVLPSAVMAYFAYKTNHGPALLRGQWKLIIEYATYYINAPCWDDNPHHDEETRAQLAALRERAKRLTPETEQEFDAWIKDCLEIGIDPL